MKRIGTVIAAGAALALAQPAHADNPPTSDDRRNAAQECRFERGTSSATREAFAQKYGGRRNAFGKCVSAKAREESRERKAATSSSSAACKAERGTTKESRAAFEQKYGTNTNKRNALGKCVSAKARAAENAADAADRDAAKDRKRAAKACDDERGATPASRAAFAQKYGTNANQRNAFGKRVSRAS